MALASGATLHLGLDLGGTYIKWVIVERDGEWAALEHGQTDTPADGGPSAVIARLAEVGAEAIAQRPAISSVGVGVPGLYDPRTGATRFIPNIPGEWAGALVAGTVGEALGLPTHLVNDARAFGLAELRLGAGRGARSMVGITLGTGVGGVIAVDGRVHQGHDGTAGEIGHHTIAVNGPECSCGSRGCLEAFTRADAIEARCGAPTVEAAVARARTGDARALDGLAETARYLGVGLANLITLITPDRLVIGGGISAAFDLLEPGIREELRLRVRTTALEEVDIRVAELGLWAGAIGAAVHGAERMWETAE